MSSQNTKSGRFTAYQLLDRFDIKKDYASKLLDRFLPQTNQPQRTTDMVYGVIRNLTAIDHVISTFAGCETQRIFRKLINIIRIAVYELVFSPKTADYAIVNEIVEITKRRFSKRHAAFVNALLRNITRNIISRTSELTVSNPRRFIPSGLLSGCEFKTDFLPDSQKSPADYLSMAFSLPLWLIENWIRNFGFEKTSDICSASNRRSSVYIRPNILKTSFGQLAKLFEDENIEFETVDNQLIKLKGFGSVTKLPGFSQGLFAVQDLTAFNVVSTLAPKPGQLILDLCSAPGTKTTHLAEFTLDKASIIATDIDTNRLSSVHQNLKRLGMKSVELVEYDFLAESLKKTGPFDTILLDVPCSNTGVLAKRPEVRHKITAKAISDLAATQYDILKKARTMLKSTARICYSTCSIEPQETSHQITKFLKENPDFTLASERLTLPSAASPDHDGGYCAVIEINKA